MDYVGRSESAKSLAEVHPLHVVPRILALPLISPLSACTAPPAPIHHAADSGALGAFQTPCAHFCGYLAQNPVK